MCGNIKTLYINKIIIIVVVVVVVKHGLLLISRFIDLRKITCISSLCSCDKLSFPPFFDLQLPLLAPNVFFCFSDHQGSVFVFT